MSHCLFVEDHADTRDGYAELLSFEGITVHIAASGEELWPLLEVDIPDAIVMDLHLPGRDGWMLIRELRAHDAWKRVPILVVSACVREMDREQAFDAGCDAFLGKPCDPSDLVAELKRLIGRSPEGAERVTTATVSVGATAENAAARSSTV